MSARQQEMFDAAWREAAEITHHQNYVLRHGKDTPETDLGLSAADRERLSAAIAFIAEQTWVSTTFVHRALEEAAGTDDNPDYLVPPDWENYADEAAAAEFYEDHEAMLANPRELAVEEIARQELAAEAAALPAYHATPADKALAEERGNHDAVSKLTSELAPGPTSAVRRASAMFDSSGAPGTTPRLAASDPGGSGIGPSPHQGPAPGESPRSGRMR